MLTLNSVIELTIDRLAYHSGHGVARHHGFVVFVPRTAPGDRLSARVIEVHKSYAIAEMLQLHEAGPERRAPPCPVADRCGGCQWQHVNYPEQVRQKQRLLMDQLRSLNLPTTGFRPLITAPHEFRYRNRIQLHRRGEDIGYFAAGTQNLVPIEDCLLAEEALVRTLPALRGADFKDAKRIEVFRDTSSNVRVRSTSREPESGQFAQVNEAQNLKLIEMVLRAVQVIEPKIIWDLYSGSGNITFPLAKHFPAAHLTGVDLSQVLIAQAQAATEKSQIARIEWHAQSVEDFLRRPNSPNVDLIVLDPPRAGLEKSARRLLSKVQAKQLIYVSCNPATLARDLGEWRALYDIEFVQGLDMFPQTAHLEAVASLIRKS